jgi:hypothetical protein
VRFSSKVDGCQAIHARLGKLDFLSAQTLPAAGCGQ